MDERNQKLIKGIIEKAEYSCPGALALIGVYGSAATGDTHEKSDLDLMLLINDDRGYSLAQAFILDDVDIGYDIYCTTWNMLEADAQCDHAQLSKLLDSKIVYVNDDLALSRLEELRKRAISVLTSDVRFQKAEKAYCCAKERYAECFMADAISDVRFYAAGVIQSLLCSVMLFHGRYFLKGIKRTFEEIEKLNLPFDMKGLVLDVIQADSVIEIRNRLTILILNVKETIMQLQEKEEPSASNLSGTYEEIYSNWKNKMNEAALNDDIYSSFMNMASFQLMLNEIESGVAITHHDLLARFDSGNLHNNFEVFNNVLSLFLREYEKAGMEAKRYIDIDAFLSAY